MNPVLVSVGTNRRSPINNSTVLLLQDTGFPSIANVRRIELSVERFWPTEITDVAKNMAVAIAILTLGTYSSWALPSST
jgi:hypothetical protein